MTTTKSVLLLTSAREPGWIDTAPTPVSQGLRSFINTLNQDGDVEYAVSTLDKLDFTINGADMTIRDRFNDKDLREYDVVHFRNVTLYPDYARAIAIYLQHHGKKVFEVSDAEHPEYGKLSQMMLFALNGLPVPATWAAWGVQDTASLYLRSAGAFPFILKANDGIKGHDNYLVRTQQELDDIIAANPELQFIAQTYIPNNKDYRVLWFDTEALVFSRSATGGSHLNNTSRGGVSAEVATDELDPTALAIARRAAQLTRRIFSGADVMQDSQTGEWYVLEINANPALSSGDLLDRKLTAYKKMIGELL